MAEGAIASCLILSDTERQTVASLINERVAVPVADFNAALLAEIGAAASELPPRLTERVETLTEGPGAGSLLIRNMPLDSKLPATPPDGRPSPEKRTRSSEYGLLLVTSVLGGTIGYAEEKDGLLVHDICPIAGRELYQENSGSTYFELHTENAFHPHCPDFVVLSCLRQDHERVARTLTASCLNALARLPRNQLELLRQPLFRIRTPSSFTAAGVGDHTTAPMPVVEETNGAVRVRVDWFNTIPQTADAEQALKGFVAALEAGLHGWALEPGDLLVVDNRIVVHARTAFRPRYDGTDRWLQRAYGVADLEASAALRPNGEHVCVGLGRTTSVNAS